MKSKLQKLKKAELIEEVIRLKDENESLWGMLDEMKESDMKNYKKQFQGMINKKIRQIQTLARKPLKMIPMAKNK